MSNETIDRVALVGGTHGNELTGIYLLNKYRQFPKLLGQHSFEVELFTANHEAHRANRRYIDRDLNRSLGMKMNWPSKSIKSLGLRVVAEQT